MKGIHNAYFVYVVLGVVMAVVMWGSTKAPNDFWRWMYFICADILLLVIILGVIYTTRKLMKNK